MNTYSPRLEARGVHAGAIVQDVHCALARGLVGLVGPNGSGKTTLLRALAGVAPYRGSVMWNGRELSKLAPRERARAIAYLPQLASVSWPVSSANLVALGRIPHGDGTHDSGRAAVSRAIAATGIAHLEARRVDTLSGGERARVLLARALCVEAPVLIADEPIAALDPRFQIETVHLLRQIADQGRLVIAAFHDMALAARFSDRVLVMQAGRLAADGTPDTVLDAERIAATFGLKQAGSDRFGPIWEPAGSR